MVQEPPLRFGIIVKPDEPRAAVVASEIAEWASRRGLSLLVDERVGVSVGAQADQIAEHCQFLIVLGGDGTMLGAARLLKGRPTPVLGINLGSLGYLTEFAVDDALPALEAVAGGDFQTDSRTMLDWRVRRGDHVVSEGTALNDVVVNKSTLARIIDIDCSLGDKYVTSYRADGLIVSTPTGSTAYNLSAGGPIIYPGTDAVVICPICPHTLTNRPLVLPDSVEITLQMNTREQEVVLASDGQGGISLTAGDRIEIRKSGKTFNTVRPVGADYFHILRTKLKWSGR